MCVMFSESEQRVSMNQRLMSRWMSKAVAVTAIVTLLVACSQGQGQNTTTTGNSGADGVVRIGVSGTFATLAQPFLAAHLGYFEEEGVEVELQITPALTGIAALIANDIQYLASGSTDMMAMAQQKQTFTAVLSFLNDYQHTLSISPASLEAKGVGPGSPLEEKFAALEGMTIAVSGHGTATDTTAQVLVKAAGLSPDDVEIVAIGSQGARVAAVQEGQIDGFVGTAPGDLQAERIGAAAIFLEAKEVDPFAGAVFNTLHGYKRWLDANPDAHGAVLRALVRANQYLKEHPREAAELLVQHEYSGLEVSDLEPAFRGMADDIPADGKMTQEGWEQLMQVALMGGLISEPLDITEGLYWTNQYLP